MRQAAYCPRCAAPLVDRVPPLDNRARKVCGACGFVVYLNPKVAAGTVPVHGGRIGLIRRGVAPGIGLWSWPCGYVEIDETIEAGALRETYEETGLRVALEGLLGAYSYPVTGDPADTAALGSSTGLLVLCWAAVRLEGELVAGDDADDAAWFRPEDLPWPELAFDSSRRALDDFLAGPGKRLLG
jgi:ADP-ribose pyrophosphatase YjhB (NUDIX family)